jgi:hypothetical protein
MEHDFASAHGLQLRQRPRVVARFADLRAVERGDLVGADHECARVLLRDRFGLGARQAQGGGFGSLAGQGRLVDMRRDRFEGQVRKNLVSCARSTIRTTTDEPTRPKKRAKSLTARG